MATEKQCVLRPGKFERRVDDITECIKKLLLAEAPGLHKGSISVEIPVLNGGFPDGSNVFVKKSISI